MKIRYISIQNFRGIKSLNSPLQGNFICLIGHGDNCKSTILSAIELTLTTRWNTPFDDSDFFNQDTTTPLVITISLCEWDNNDENVKSFFTENKFGQFVGGFGLNGPETEPTANGLMSITIQLVVDQSLEPKWQIIKGSDSKPISASERNIFGLGRIDTYLDNNFTWSKNSLLTKLSSNRDDNLTQILTNISRTVRDNELELAECNTVAIVIQTESSKFGVRLGELKAKVDIQKISLASGSLALHQDNIPLRSFGTGSKKLISCSMQMKIHNGKSITLIDEIELGLEPHRIRGLIKKLKETNQQIITTSHSPVVLRELNVVQNELYTCKRDSFGNIDVKSFSAVPASQGPLRSNAEAFLGKKIIICEGATEIGCLRALDHIKTNGENIPVWTLNTAYYNAGGIGQVKEAATALKQLGYDVAVLCDNDDPNSFSVTDAEALNLLGVSTFVWEDGLSIEKQLFRDLEWESLSSLVEVIAVTHDTRTVESLIASVRSKDENLAHNVTEWVETANLRAIIGDASAGKEANNRTDGKKAWFKRIDYAEEVFKFSIPNLKINSLMKTKLDELWAWVQHE